MSNADHSYVARYEVDDGDELPLEVRERERARMLVALRDYLDRIEVAPMTEQTAIVFAARWEQEPPGGNAVLGFGDADEIAHLLLNLTVRSMQVDLGEALDGDA